MSSPAAALSPELPEGAPDSLLLLLGDQLEPGPLRKTDFDRDRGAILMIESRGEAEHVPSHRQRIVLFLSAMRHRALDLQKAGYAVRYVKLDDPRNTGGLDSELSRAVVDLKPERVLVTEPGEHRVRRMLEKAVSGKARMEILPDTSFTTGIEEFNRWAEGRKSLVMEHFYRERRRKLDVLIRDGSPVGGKWNTDKENRKAFRSAPDVPSPYAPRADAVTREVVDLVNREFPEAPGEMEEFRWPVTQDQARRALDRFIDRSLKRFGTYEDAMWEGETFLYHSALSSSLNLKLLDPMRCVEAALEAYESGGAAINNVEGFVRQIIGWREFIRGVYYREGEGYPARNTLDQHGDLPWFFWTGETDMNCLRHCLGDVVTHAYSHHITRLMVIGNFALIAGVHPARVHSWFLAMYVDAVEWVTAPNVVGMSQHADGGVVGTKPYAASGKYIDRMSNFCRSCPYDVKRRAGKRACPFNVFYWDFLMRNEERLRGNRRMSLVLRGLERLDEDERRDIRSTANRYRREFKVGSPR